jgi:predicted nucleic acid-binding protein
VAALFDTTVGVLLLRRRPPAEAAELIRAARLEIEAGSAVLAAPAASELLIGAKRGDRVGALSSALGPVPTAVLSSEAARMAGEMGAFLAMRGASIPFPDLLIAATAVWLEIPLLAWDADYPHSRSVALTKKESHPGAELWRRLHLHPASLGADA